MQAYFFTSEFELSHGKRPSGRGSWAFEVQCQSDLQLRCLLDPQRQGVIRVESIGDGKLRLWTKGNTLYADAKAQVKSFLRGHFTTVDLHVCT